MMRRLYLDTNVFIAAFETEGEQSDLAWTLLDSVTNGQVLACTSELTLAELLPKPLALRSQLFVELYSRLLQSSDTLIVASVSRPILIHAAEVRSAHSTIRLPDAIHIATALQMECVAFVSDDRRLRGFEALPIINLTGASLQRITDFEP